MHGNKFWVAVGKTLAVVTVMLIIVLLLAPAAGAASKYKTLYKFKGGKNGNGSFAGLISDAAGNLYGTTVYGGAYNTGTAFELTPTANGGWTQSVLYNFNCADGCNPQFESLVLDGAGNLYGTLAKGGADGVGLVFELTPTASGWTEQVLHSFTGGEDGGNSWSGVTFDAAGNLYGTTWNGGTYGSGVIFKLSPYKDGSWSESVLHTFTGGSDGGWSDSGLIFDSAGNLYGVTWGPQSVVFKLAPNPDGSWTESVLCQFKGGKHGYTLRAHLIFDSAGNLYGTTKDGGLDGYGIVFELIPNPDGTWTKRTLHQFTGGRDGANPDGGLIFDSAGNLYGTTPLGGSAGYGVVFKLTPTPAGTWSYHVVRAFMDKPGAHPYSGLVLDGAGNLYGTTMGDSMPFGRSGSEENGSKTFGSVYEITP